MVDCQAPAYSIFDQENCAKGENTREQVALACMDHKSLA
jgi:hypothetical protein